MRSFEIRYQFVIKILVQGKAQVETCFLDISRMEKYWTNEQGDGGWASRALTTFIFMALPPSKSICGACVASIFQIIFNGTE